jgi:hypothetical protein
VKAEGTDDLHIRQASIWILHCFCGRTLWCLLIPEVLSASTLLVMDVVYMSVERRPVQEAVGQIEPAVMQVVQAADLRHQALRASLT